MVKNMTEDGKVKIRTKIGYGAIAGVVTGVVNFIVEFLVSSIKLGTYDPIDSGSQQFLGTSAGNPNLVGISIISIVFGALVGIIYGITLFLLMTRLEGTSRKAGYERDLPRYLILAIVMEVVLFLIDIMSITAEFDLLIDGSIRLIIIVILIPLILALTFYYLEERFESAS